MILCIALLGAYWSSVEWLFSEWNTSSGLFSHGYFVVAISAWLLYRSIPALAGTAIRPDWRFQPILLATSLVWLLGSAANIAVVQTTVIPALLLFAIAAIFGLAATTRIAFAVLFLYFAFPLWEYLQFIFQAITVFVVEFALMLVGVAVFVEGNFVSIAAGKFEIAGGCSGINFILVSTSLAALYGHLYYDSTRNRWVLVAIALSLAVLTNWVRVSWVILAGHLSEMQSPLIEDHSTFGWVLFGFSMIPLFILARRLEPESLAPVVPARRRASVDGRRSRSIWVSAAVALVAMTVGPVWATMMLSSAEQGSMVTITLPDTNDMWHGPQAIPGIWEPVFHGASGEKQGVYTSEEGRVWVYENVYLVQQQDKELIFLKNSVAGAWRVRETQNISLTLFDGTEHQVRQEIADSRSGLWLIWYWYVVDGRSEISPAAVKLRQSLATLVGRPAAGLIALATNCESDCDDAATRIEGLMTEMGSRLELNYVVGGE